MLRKIIHYIFLISEEFTQDLKVSSYPFHLTGCCLIPFLLRVRTILSIWKSVWAYSDLENLVIVKLAFDRTRLQFWQIVYRLRNALDKLDNLKYFSWKVLFIPIGKFYIFLCYSYKISHFEIDTLLKNFTPETIRLLPYRVNVWGVYVTWWHTYCGMDRVVGTC